ncbi:hypothetical protein [Lacipirellula sp.]|uniref:hypothetical protein n=1 Tax=Lacipirellula sp. TaxID=2691419 RepID=UPI003D0F6F8C
MSSLKQQFAKFVSRWGTVGLLAIGAAATPAWCHAQSLAYATTDPDIEMWFYPVSTANGSGSVRDRGSSFATYSYVDDDGNVQFYGGDGYDSSRRGSVLLATNTTSTIPKLDPSRYQIDSLRLTVTLMGNIGEIAYDGTADDYFQITGGTDDPGKPIELWGVGFGGAYTTFGFAGETGPEYFNSGDRRWPIAAGSFSGPYQVYSVDGAGNDVENAIFGGYSATAPGNETEQFSPTPFAVGKAYDSQGVELAPGTMLGAGTQLTFDVNLNDPGVVSYLQHSLAAGNLGFFLSSLHEPLAHTGEVAYPDYFLDNNPSGPNPNGNAPTFELAVTILNEAPSADFNGDGVVDGGDFLTWQRGYGSQYDDADLAAWKSAFAAGPNGLGSVAAVPEPHAAALAAVGTLGLAAFGRRRSFAVRN